MGEQIHSFTPANTLLPIMRSSRGKLFVYLVVLGGMGFVIFLLSSVHSNLKQMESSNEKCQQQRDSLSAQLQVVYEHKNRLEKSLQQEKTDHRHTKEEHEKQLQDRENRIQQEKDKRQSIETQLTQLKTSYAELEVDKKHAETLIKDQLQTMQAQKDQEIKKLRTHISKLLEEKDKLEQSSAALAWKVEQNANDANVCRQQQELLQQQLSLCKEEKQKPPPPEVQNLNRNVAKHDEENDIKDAVPSHPTYKTAATLSKEKQNVLQKPNIHSPDEKAAEAFQLSLNMPKNGSNNNVNNENLPENHSPNAKAGKETNDLNEMKKAAMLNNNNINNNNNNENDVHDMNNAVYQFQPPDSQNQAAERGEYANAAQHQQVEKPVFREPNFDTPMKNNIPIPQDNYAAQARLMLEKSPDDNNPFNKKGGSNQFLGGDLGDDRLNKFQADVGVPKPDHDLPEMEDKHQYDDDDDDQDGDNEDNVGAGQGHQDKQFNEPDFVDQESKDNPKGEEGVMVAPK